MKRHFIRLSILFFFLTILLFGLHANAASRTLDPFNWNGDNALGSYGYDGSVTINLEQEDFKGVDTVYLKLVIPRSGILSLHGMGGYSTKKIWASTNTYDVDLPYQLCDKNKKPIDPYGKKTTFYLFGIPNNPFYTVGQGTYYVKLYNGKIKPYKIIISASLKTRTGSGGKSKKKALTLKKGKASRVVIPLGRNTKDNVWFKFYTDGKKPVKITYTLEEVAGKFDITYYGPSYPKGLKHVLPDTVSYGITGSFGPDRSVSKNGVPFESEDTTDTLFRKNATSTIGPKKGWYYIKFSKIKEKNKKNQNYQKRSICISLRLK